MLWIICLIQCICLSSCIDIDNYFSNTLSECVVGATTPINCFITDNIIISSEETNDINLNEDILYTITTSSSTSEKLVLTLNVKKINVKGNCTFKNLIVCCYLDYLDFFFIIL
jgi:hypothetical protein